LSVAAPQLRATEESSQGNAYRNTGERTCDGVRFVLGFSGVDEVRDDLAGHGVGVGRRSAGICGVIQHGLDFGVHFRDQRGRINLQTVQELQRLQAAKPAHKGGGASA
jgi:hypothetical protein